MTGSCEQVILHTKNLWACKETDNGARIRTTCIFPSFEPVFVYVARLGDGFFVHDAGETMAVILAHGCSGDAAKRFIQAESKRYGLNFEKRRISLRIDALEWLESAIVAVANTCSSAARLSLRDASKKPEHDLADVIFGLLEPRVPKGTLVRNYPYKGASGRGYKFDLAVLGKKRLTLIETVVAYANSVNSKYVAFADVPESEDVLKIAAHDGDLPSEDILLLQNVATVAGPDGVSVVMGLHDNSIH